MNDGVKAIIQWCEEHQLLYLAVVFGLIAFVSQWLGPLGVEFVTGSPLDSKARFLAKFVTGIGCALVFGVTYGYLRGRYYREAK